MKVLVTFLAAIVIANAAPVPQWDHNAELVLRIVLEAPPAANQVWPGFDMTKRTFGVQADSGTYLYTPGPKPAGFFGSGPILFREGKLPGFEGIMSINHPIGDLKATIVRKSEKTEVTAETLYHEAFHAFQTESWQRPVAALDARSVQLTAEQAASIEIERRLLAQALQDLPSPRSALVDALAVRYDRSAQSGSALQAAERLAETVEGLAEYVGQISMARALERNVARSKIIGLLMLPMKTMSGSPDERLIRARGYGTGAAFALLLDALSPEWKSQVPGVPLDQLAADAVGLRDVRLADVASNARTRHGYDKLVRSTDPPWGTLKVFSEKEFDALAPFRVVVGVSEKPNRSFAVSAGNPLQGLHRPREGVLLLPETRTFNIQDGALTIAVTKRPVRVDLGKEVAAPSATVLLQRAPRVNGQTMKEGEHSLEKLDLVGDGVRITSTTPVKVVVEQNVMRVLR